MSEATFPPCKTKVSVVEDAAGHGSADEGGPPLAAQAGGDGASNASDAQAASHFVQAASAPGRPSTTVTNGPGSAPGQPFGAVWIVFYWVLRGIVLMILGMGVAVAGVNTGMPFADRHAIVPHEAWAAGQVLQAASLEFFGVVLAHLGLFTLVVCYGLWTSRRWGRICALALAVVFVGADTALLTACTSVGPGIVASLADLVLGLTVLVYLIIGRPRVHSRICDPARGS